MRCCSFASVYSEPMFSFGVGMGCLFTSCSQSPLRLFGHTKKQVLATGLTSPPFMMTPTRRRTVFVRGRAVAWAFVAIDLSPVFACGTGIAEAWLAGAGLVVAVEGGLLNRKTLATNAEAPRHTHRTMSSQTLRNVFDMPCVWRVSQDVGEVKSALVNYYEARVFFLLPSIAEVSLGRLGWRRSVERQTDLGRP